MTSYPTPAEVLTTEVLGPHFSKFHLGHGLCLHRFTEACDVDYHDHPYGFTSHVLTGGYREEILLPNGDGTYRVEVFERHPGTSHRVEAATVHRLIGFLGDATECLTLAQPGPWEQNWYHYRLDEDAKLTMI